MGERDRGGRRILFVNAFVESSACGLSVSSKSLQEERTKTRAKSPAKSFTPFFISKILNFYDKKINCQ